MRIQILIVSVLLLGLVQSLKIKDFEPNLFKFTSIEEGFRVVDTGSARVGQVMAFSDLDGDRFTDYVAVESRNTSQLLFYVWNHQKEQFTQYTRNLTVNASLNIKQIIVYDLNQNGQNEIIITTEDNSSITTYIFSLTCITCNDSMTLLPGSEIDNQQAVPFLLENQGQVNLVVFSGNNRYLYFYNFSSSSYIQTAFSSILNNNVSTFNSVDKHFASTIDLNSDCFADLMIVSYTGVNSTKSYQLELYEKSSNNKFSLQRKLNLNLASGNGIQKLVMVTWTDLDNSGSVDIVFFYETNGQFYASAQLNGFVPQQVCQVSNLGVFPYQDINLSSLPAIQLPQGYNLSSESIPHFNDVNADGLPDILTMMQSDGYRKVVILINQRNLQFSNYDDQWKAYDLNNPSQSLFYDYGEDGKIDLMILSQERKTVNNITTTSYTRTSIVNNIQSDTLHLKVLPLSISSHYNEDQKKIQNAFGVTTNWLFTDIDGNKLVKISNQKFQFNHGIMQLPYAYTGLGRTNNYLEEFTVGYQRYGQKEDWSPIIPNSQLMVYKEHGSWRLQTLLKNNERVNDVIYVSIMILLCLGSVIIYLGNKEAQQDKRDHYNFIQLIR